MAAGGSENHYLLGHGASRGSKEWEGDWKEFIILCKALNSTHLCSSRHPDQLPCCLVLHHVLFWGFLWAPRLTNDFRGWEAWDRFRYTEKKGEAYLEGNNSMRTGSEGWEAESRLWLKV